MMVPFPDILIPDAAMEWKWDANCVYRLLFLRLIPYLILKRYNRVFLTTLNRYNHSAHTVMPGIRLHPWKEMQRNFMYRS